MTTEQPKGCRTLTASNKYANIPRFHCKAVLQLWSKYIHIFLDIYTGRKDSSRCKTNSQLYCDELTELFPGSVSIRKVLIRGALQIPQLPCRAGKSTSANWESPKLGSYGACCWAQAECMHSGHWPSWVRDSACYRLPKYLFISPQMAFFTFSNSNCIQKWLLEEVTTSEDKCPLRATSHLWLRPHELATKRRLEWKTVCLLCEISPYLCMLSVAQDNNPTCPA